MANLGPNMPGLAASTASRVDSSSKHIVACRVGEHYMLEWCNAPDNNKRRELHVNKHKYCAFKNELALNVTRSLYPLQSLAQYNETKAYPSIVTTLADMDEYSKAWLKALYKKSLSAGDWSRYWRDTLLALQAADEDAYKNAMRPLMESGGGVHDATIIDCDGMNAADIATQKKHIKNMPYFTAQGYALGTAWASQQTGDTVASVLIGGMQTVMNGAFACAAGDVLQWYFDFEEDQFAHKTHTVNNPGPIVGDIVVHAGQRAVYTAQDAAMPQIAETDRFAAPDEARQRAEKRRRVCAERQDGVFTDGDKVGTGMKAGTFNKNADVWKSTGCGKAFPKPYRLALTSNGYADHYGDRIRIFAKCISSARPHEMVDVMLMTQSL